MPIELKNLDNQAQYDVVVVGAGMVGASAALGLSDMGYQVLLIDAFKFDAELPSYTPSYDDRSTALSWGTRKILEQLHVWTEIESQAFPMTQVHVSEKGRLGSTRINAEDYQQQALGYVVPNRWLGQALLGRVYQRNIDFVSGVEIKSITRSLTEQGGSHELLISAVQDASHSLDAGTPRASQEGVVVRSKLLVLADGTESSTARLLGIDYDVEAYQQHALVANVSTSDPHAGVAFERFTEQGPLAMLPLHDSDCALVWTHDDADIQDYLDMDDQQFCEALESVFGERLGVIEKCGKRVAYPLRLVKAKEQCRQGVLLLGNAAHSLHPVAGQGFNLAIRGVAAFLEYARTCFDEGTDISSLSGLRHLCEQRQLDQYKTITMSDQLIKLFGSQVALLHYTRDLGLLGLDNIKPLKTAFSAQAMGLAQRKARF